MNRTAYNVTSTASPLDSLLEEDEENRYWGLSDQDVPILIGAAAGQFCFDWRPRPAFSVKTLNRPFKWWEIPFATWISRLETNRRLMKYLSCSWSDVSFSLLETGAVGFVFLILGAIVIWYCCQFAFKSDKSIYSKCFMILHIKVTRDLSSSIIVVLLNFDVFNKHPVFCFVTPSLSESPWFRYLLSWCGGKLLSNIISFLLRFWIRRQWSGKHNEWRNDAFQWFGSFRRSKYQIDDKDFKCSTVYCARKQSDCFIDSGSSE